MTTNQNKTQENIQGQNPQGDQISLEVVIAKLGQRIATLTQANVVQETLLELKDKQIADLNQQLSLKGGDNS